jgi:hypothetical protein
MPNKSRNNSRKSTASSQGKPSVRTNDDDFPSIIMINKPPTSRKNTPKSKSSPSTQSPRPDFLEPLSPKPIATPPPPSPWEILGLSESDYRAMMLRLDTLYRDMRRKDYENNLAQELNDPWFWRSRIESFEQEREYFNKKRGWSAADIACVDKIDEQIHECEEELERIYAEEDRLEVEYD